jgi:hypothetical protein
MLVRYISCGTHELQALRKRAMPATEKGWSNLADIKNEEIALI